DVRRLIALFGNEPLEQHLHACRVYLGYAEAVAHSGIGGRAASLTQDSLAACIAHDVVNGEKVRLVLQLRDERELVVDQRTGLGDVDLLAGGETAAPTMERPWFVIRDS